MRLHRKRTAKVESARRKLLIWSGAFDRFYHVYNSDNHSAVAISSNRTFFHRKNLSEHDGLHTVSVNERCKRFRTRSSTIWSGLRILDARGRDVLTGRRRRPDQERRPKTECQEDGTSEFQTPSNSFPASLLMFSWHAVRFRDDLQYAMRRRECLKAIQRTRQYWPLFLVSSAPSSLALHC